MLPVPQSPVPLLLGKPGITPPARLSLKAFNDDFSAYRSMEESQYLGHTICTLQKLHNAIRPACPSLPVLFIRKLPDVGSWELCFHVEGASSPQASPHRTTSQENPEVVAAAISFLALVVRPDICPSSLCSSALLPTPNPLPPHGSLLFVENRVKCILIYINDHYPYLVNHANDIKTKKKVKMGNPKTVHRPITRRECQCRWGEGEAKYNEGITSSENNITFDKRKE